MMGIIGRKSPVDSFHFVDSLSESVLIVLNSDLSPEELSDFANVLKLCKELLVVASALGGGSGADEGRELVVELHFSDLGGEYLIFFLEVMDFLWISMKIV